MNKKIQHSLARLFFLITLLLTAENVRSQQFINGSFETNTAAGACQWNLSNTAFNSMLPDCYAFGSMNEPDIQFNTCNYGTVTPDGEYFISLHSETPGGGSDEVSVFTDIPMVAGTSYTLSLDVSADISFDNLDTLLIGISADSSQFGTLLYKTLAVPSVWTPISFTFTAPVTTRFITFKNIELDAGWNFVDGLSLNTPSGIAAPVNNGIQVYPLLATDELTVKTVQPAQYAVYDVRGRKCLEGNVKPGQNNINVISLAPGVYVLILQSGGRTTQAKFLKQ